MAQSHTPQVRYLPHNLNGRMCPRYLPSSIRSGSCTSQGTYRLAFFPLDSSTLRPSVTLACPPAAQPASLNKSADASAQACRAVYLQGSSAKGTCPVRLCCDFPATSRQGQDPFLDVQREPTNPTRPTTNTSTSMSMIQRHRSPSCRRSSKW